MGYTLNIERGWENLPELLPLYATHYQEMKDRLEADGHQVGPFKMRQDVYLDYWRSGALLNYVVRTESGEAVGYSNVYLTNDMHNCELIAQEDTIFIVKAHRNGVGKKLVRFVLDDLRSRGVKRVHVTAVTDLRVSKLWRRMGFKNTADFMTFYFED